MFNLNGAAATGVTASAGTAGAIGCLFSGLSASASVSLLATAGEIIGAGMAGGALVIAAAPVAVGLATYGIYKALED